MMIFGGIFEITKELNDAHVFDIKNKKWIMLFSKNSTVTNSGAGASPTKSQYSFSQNSPLARRGTLRRGNLDASPSMVGRASLL